MWLFLTPIIAKHLKSRNRTREVLDKCEREEIIPRYEAPSEPSGAAGWVKVLGEGEDGKREMGNVASVIMLPISSFNFQLGIGIGYWQHFQIGNIIQWCFALGFKLRRRTWTTRKTNFCLKVALKAPRLKDALKFPANSLSRLRPPI